MGASALNPARALKSMNFVLMDGVIYVRHREQPVRDDDWQLLLDEISRTLTRRGSLKILVKTDNAGPNVVQRGKINDLVSAKEATLRIAVLSSSVMVRGIVTAFSWMRTMRIKSFGPSDFAGGLAFLEEKVPVGVAERTMADVERLVG